MSMVQYLFVLVFKKNSLNENNGSILEWLNGGKKRRNDEIIFQSQKIKKIIKIL